MTSKRRILPLLVALLIWENLNSIHASSESPSSSQPTSEKSTSLPLKNTDTSIFSDVVDESTGRKKAISTGSREKSRPRDPPGSPVKLFMPDEFQFYTLNGYGQLVMKQMTKQEIQGMIAASVGDGGSDGGGSIVDPGKHQIQLTDDVPKVSDVVHNVQKVLKGELNKPVQLHPSSSSIPGNVNSQWSNMLPYILSGGSVDQQDVAQDASIILPTLDVDQSYIDVVPLQEEKHTNDHYESGSNYVHSQPTSNKQEINIVNRKPTLSTSEKPIYLLGNMALDSDILGEQETYTLQEKERPSRPTLTSMYQKFTTTKPFNLKDTAILQNSTNGKPTLYIPLSVSSQLQTNLHNHNNQLDIYKIQSYIPKPSQENHTSTLGNHEDLTITNTLYKKTTAYGNSGGTKFTKLPMIQVPVISADKVISSTQRTNQNKTPTLEILPTISSETVSSTNFKDGSHTTKINVENIGGYKNPGTYYKPSTLYPPMYEPITKSTTNNFMSASSYFPVYETSSKLSTLNIAPTYRPIYHPLNKINTTKLSPSTHRPVYESVTKPNIVNTLSLSTDNLLNKLEMKTSTTILKPDFSQWLYETSTKSTNGLKTPQYSGNTYQTYTSEKNSPSVLEVLASKNTQNVELKVTKSPTNTQNTIIKNDNKNQPLVQVNQQLREHEKHSNVSFVTKNTEETSINSLKIPSYNNNQVNPIAVSTTSNFIDTYNHNTVSSTDKTEKLTEQTTENSEWNKDFYNVDENNGKIYSTILPVNTEGKNKLSTIHKNITKTLNQSEIVNTIATSLEQTMKTDEYNKYEESSTYSSINTQEFKTESSFDYYTPITKNDTTKQPEILYNQTNTPTEVIETIVPDYDIYSIKEPHISESINQNQPYLPITTDKTTEGSLNTQKEPNTMNNIYLNKNDKISSWIQSETTTQFIPMYDSTTEYNSIKYDFNEVKKPISSAYEESSFNTQDSTVIPSKNNNITSQSDIDSIVEYSTLLNKIIDLSYTNHYSKQPISKNQTTKPINANKIPVKENYQITTKIYENSVTQNNNINIKKPTYGNIQIIVENNTSTYKHTTEALNDKITPMYTSSYKIRPTNYDKFTTENFVNVNQNKDSDVNIYFTKPSLEGAALVTESNKPQTAVTVNENKILPLNFNSFVDNSNIKSTIQYSTISPHTSNIENNFNQFDSFNTGNATATNEKVETITEELALFKTENDKYDNKYLLQEDQISTIKVIPVYDDDTYMYTLPVNYPSQTTPKIISNIKLSENSNLFNMTNLSSNKIPQVLKPINEDEYKPIYQITDSVTPSIATTPLVPSYITQNISAQDTILPDLGETFNNYLKENYDSKLSTTDNYNEVPYLTTFSTFIDESPSSSTNQFSTLTTSNHIKTNVPEYQTMKQKLQLNMNLTTVSFKNNVTKTPNYFSSTSSYTSENFDNSKSEQDLDSVTKSTISKEIYSTESLDDNIFTTKYPGMNNKNVETPITYLDLKNSDSDKQSISHESNNNHMSNSSFTRIKIKNTIADVDKIISEAPTPTNTPFTMQYILSNYYKSPNTIASGLIAGYPTYNQVKTTTEYFTDTTLYDNAGETSSSSTNKDLLLFPLNKELENVSQKDKNFSYQDKSTTLLVENDKNYMDKTSSIPIYISEDEETTTYNYEAFEVTNYESSTPIESLPMSSKTEIPSQTEEKYDPSLEKISDLINRLKDKSTERDPVVYGSSNGMTTTVIPLERFETIIDESNATPTGITFTTISDNIKKTSAESQNNTYIAIQNLPYSKPYLSSTESTGHYNATRKQNIEVTTDSVSKVRPNSGATTLLTVMKQPVTGQPHMTSTYSATKGLFEKTQSTIDKSAGRINLEEEKNKMQKVKPTESAKFTMKNKIYYTTDKKPASEGYQSYTRKTTRPINNKGTTIFNKEYTTSKSVGITKESNIDKWTLIPQKNIAEEAAEIKQQPLAMSSKEGAQQLNPQVITLDHATGAIGLDQSNKGLDKDVAEFLNMCNELSFKFWTLANSELSSSRSVTLSPFGMISTLAMIFLGARGLTSNQMNDILKLDDVVTFNPHLVFQNITDTVTLARGQGIQNAAFVRSLFADRLKVRKIMPFYKEQAQQFYEGAVVDINFSTAGDILRRRTNLLIRKQTGGRIKDFVKTHTVPLRSPLTALSANVFQTSCDSPDASSEGRDGEMYFAVSQTVKQRKLVPIPAVVWKSGVLAGYEPSLDATAVALGDAKRPVSLIMVMPGQQGLTAAGDNLERLEHRLFGNPSDNALEKLLKVIVPRRVEVQIPKFSHRSIVNITSALKKLGFDQLFTKTADLKGINGAGHDLYLADMLQMNLFYTCGDENKLGARPLSETFPGSSSRHTRASETNNNVKARTDEYLENNESDGAEAVESSRQDNEDDDCEDWMTSDDLSSSNINTEVLQSQLPGLGKESIDRIKDLRQKLHKKRLWSLTPEKHRRCRNRRQAETEKSRMKMDKPFLYLIRHNLTGLILHIGRFNPKNQS